MKMKRYVDKLLVKAIKNKKAVRVKIKNRRNDFTEVIYPYYFRMGGEHISLVGRVCEELSEYKGYRDHNVYMITNFIRKCEILDDVPFKEPTEPIHVRPKGRYTVITDGAEYQIFGRKRDEGVIYIYKKGEKIL